MNILVLPDSYKGSLSSKQACEIAESVLKCELPQAKITSFQIADGGEGTCDSFIEATNGRKINVTVHNAEQNLVNTYYGESANSQVAMIEVAKIVGYKNNNGETKNIYDLTTFGVGECIKDALDRGYKKIIVSAGGSSTNDAGIGLLTALGVKFYNKKGESLCRKTKSILEVDTVDYSNLDKRIKDVELILARDVSNHLLGENGASFVFGPQKGLNEEQIYELDQAFKKYSKLINQKLAYEDGSGSAGGIGYALLTLGAKSISGAKLLVKELNLNKHFKDADIIITGEGKTDHQTISSGKLPYYIASEAKELNEKVKVILISGFVDYNITNLYNVFDSVHSITNGPMTLEESMKNASHLYKHKIKNISALLN